MVTKKITQIPTAWLVVFMMAVFASLGIDITYGILPRRGQAHESKVEDAMATNSTETASIIHKLDKLEMNVDDLTRTVTEQTKRLDEFMLNESHRR